VEWWGPKAAKKKKRGEGCVILGNMWKGLLQGE